jgi:hypothetical protein
MASSFKPAAASTLTAVDELAILKTNLKLESHSPVLQKY